MKQFSLTGREARLFYGILNRMPQPDVSSMRRVLIIFDTIGPKVEEYERALEEGQKKPTDKVLEKKAEDLGGAKTEFKFENSVLDYAYGVFEGFVRASYQKDQGGKLQGITGRESIKLFVCVLDAIKSARDI